jgi:hypothetical protein
METTAHACTRKLLCPMEFSATNCQDKSDRIWSQRRNWSLQASSGTLCRGPRFRPGLPLVEVPRRGTHTPRPQRRQPGSHPRMRRCSVGAQLLPPIAPRPAGGSGFQLAGTRGRVLTVTTRGCQGTILEEVQLRTHRESVQNANRIEGPHNGVGDRGCRSSDRAPHRRPSPHQRPRPILCRLRRAVLT